MLHQHDDKQLSSKLTSLGNKLQTHKMLFSFIKKNKVKWLETSLPIYPSDFFQGFIC